jgi:hypothetical protein
VILFFCAAPVEQMINDREGQGPLHFLVFAVTGYFLLWVAIFNGYPSFYPDTGEYLVDSFTLHPPFYRTIIYSLFIRLVSLGMSPWLIVLAQSSLVIFVLYAIFKYVVEASLPAESEAVSFCGLVAFLALGTSLPWVVGQLMPDVFTGLTFLSAFLLLYDSKLSGAKMVALSGVLLISVGSHLSHFMALMLLFLVIIILRAFDGSRQFWPARTTSGIFAFVLLPIMASMGVVALANWRAGYGPTLSPAGPVFLLGRLFESGMAADYLREQCAVEQFAACKYLQDLPRDQNDFLWGRHPLLNEMGGWQGSRAQASKIVFAAIRHSPTRFLIDSGKQMFRQFVSFSPGDGNAAIRSGYAFDVFKWLYPGDLSRFQLTRQWTGSLAKDSRRMAPLYITLFWCCLVASLAFLIRRPLPARPADQLFVLTLIFLFSNALVTGALSGVNQRYQSRVSWLMGLCGAAYVLPVLLHRLNGGREPGIES